MFRTSLTVVHKPMQPWKTDTYISKQNLLFVSANYLEKK